MKDNSLSEREQRIWLMTAMSVPAVHAASSCSWLSVLLLGAVCAAICWGMDVISYNKELSKWVLWIRYFWMAPVLAWVMRWSALYWQGSIPQTGVALSLLTMAAAGALSGEERSARSGNILRYFIAALVGAVLLSGLKDIRPENLKPRWQMGSADVILVFLIPAVIATESGSGSGIRSKIRVVLLAAATAAIGSGVLSLRETVKLQAPFYELSRSASVFSVAKRFESLAACGMTLGFYAVVNFLLNRAVVQWKGENRSRAVIGLSLLSAGLYLVSEEIDSRTLTMGVIIAWILLPVIDIMKNNYKKFQNGIDKNGMKW